MNLDPDMVLGLAPDVELRILSDGTVELHCNRVRAFCPDYVLTLCAIFRRPQRVGDALARLGAESKSAAEWVDLTSVLATLVEMGALCDPSKPVQRTHARRGFGRPSEHISMLNDHDRTEAFLAAIHETVRPDDVVLDIGTGTGVLAIAAAKAGARRVYAVEASDMAEVARRIAAENGVADRVVVVRGWSTDIELPERASLLVSETIGSEAFEEDVLPILWDARKRLLVDGARMLPSRVILRAALVEVPETRWAAEVYTRAAADAWSSRYGIDFGSLAQVEAPTRLFVARPELRGWRLLSEIVRLGEVDLATSTLRVEMQAEGRAAHASDRAAVVTFFELPLTPSVTCSQDPRRVSTTPDWPCPVWITPHATTVDEGQPFELRYSRDVSSALSLHLR